MVQKADRLKPRSFKEKLYGLHGGVPPRNNLGKNIDDRRGQFSHFRPVNSDPGTRDPASTIGDYTFNPDFGRASPLSPEHSVLPYQGAGSAFVPDVNDMRQINWNEEVPEGKINFFSKPKTQLSDEQANTRAMKFAFATGMDPVAVKKEIDSDREGVLREGVAREKSLDDDRERLHLIQTVTQALEGPINFETANIIDALTYNREVNPNTVIEKDYIDRIVSELYFNDDNGLYRRAEEEDPIRASTILDVMSDNMARMEVGKKIYEDLGGKWKDTQFGVKVLDFLEGFVPFANWSTISDDPTYGDLLGTSKRKDIQKLWALPTVDEFEKALSDRVQSIAKYNLFAAYDFLQSVFSYGSSDEFFDNFMSQLDIASVPGVGIGTRAAVRGIKGVSAVKDVAKALRDTQKVVTKPKVDIPEILSSAGKTEKAAKVQVHNNLAQEFYAQRDQVASGVSALDKKNMQSVFSHIPSFMDPFRVYRGNFKLDREIADRVFKLVSDQSLSILRNIASKNGIARLPPAAEAAMIDGAYAQARKDFPTASNAVMDLEYIPAESTPTNVASYVARIKTPWGDPFHVRENAEYWAKNEYQLKDYTIEQQGTGYVINAGVRDLDETSSYVKDKIIETGNETPDSLANMFLGNYRSADYVLPTDQKAARKRLIHGKQETLAVLKEVAKPVGKIHGKSKRNFLRFTEMLRDKIRKDASGKPVRGEFYNSLADFESEWQQAFGKLPTEKEAKAYFSYVKAHQWDYIMKNMSTYRSKARAGWRMVTLRPPKTSASKALTGKAPVMPEFEARILDADDFESIISEKGNRGFLAWDPEKDFKQFFAKSELKGDTKAAFVESLKNDGYQIIQIVNPFLRPLKDVAGDSHVIDYVITKSFDTKRIPFEQIPYSPGGPVGYKYNYWIKQPKISNIMERVLYFGDQTLRPAETLKKAQRLAKSYEQARKLYNDYRTAVRRKKGSAPELQAFEDFVNNNLAETPTKLITMFRSGQLNPDQPIAVVRSGRRSVEDESFRASLGEFESVLDSPENLSRSIDSEYAGERGFNLQGVEEGTEENPLFNLQSPKLIDPLSMIDRAVNRMVNNQFFQDYRVSAVEHFVEEFADTQTVSKQVLRSNPLAYFYKPRWNESVDLSKRRAAENFLNATKDLLGVRTETQRSLGYVKEKLYETVFEKFGERPADLLDDWVLSNISDPIAAARSAVFHVRLGLFAVPQLFRQAQTVTHAIAISPKHGLFGLQAYVPMRMAVMNEGWTEHMASVAKLAGWKPEEFKEAADFLRRSGIMHVEGEHIWKDDLKDPKVFRTGFGKMLDKGQIFFREGERISRITAFNTAYLDWKRANPGKKLTRRDEDSILLRQDIMNVNMTQASRAQWQRGVWNLPTQFLSYQVRLWEQMTGKTLTKAEKMRIVGVYSAMYGVPVAATGTLLPIWPWYEDIRQSMLENGIDWDDTAAELFHTGLMATILHAFTGEEYDVGEQLGPGGIHVFKDIISGDASKTVLAILLGPTGQTVDDFWTSSYPVFEDIRAVFNEGPDADRFKVMANDFNDLFRGISSWNYAYKMYAGLRYGQLVTKNEELLGKVDTIDSVLMGTLGLNPRDLDDVYRWFESGREQAGYQNEVKKQVIKYLRRGWKAEDRAEQIANFKQAKMWQDLGDFRPDQYMDIVSEAAKGYENTIDEVNRRMLLERAPPSQAKERFERYKKDQRGEVLNPGPNDIPVSDSGDIELLQIQLNQKLYDRKIGGGKDRPGYRPGEKGSVTIESLRRQIKELKGK